MTGYHSQHLASVASQGGSTPYQGRRFAGNIRQMRKLSMTCARSASREEVELDLQYTDLHRRNISTICNGPLDTPRNLSFLAVTDLVECAFSIVEDYFDKTLLVARS